MRIMEQVDEKRNTISTHRNTHCLLINSPLSITHVCCKSMFNCPPQHDCNISDIDVINPITLTLIIECWYLVPTQCT